MMGNGLLAGLVAITAPSGFVSPFNGFHHWRNRRSAGLSGGPVLRSRSRSTIRLAPSPCTASTACGVSSRWVFSPMAR